MPSRPLDSTGTRVKTASLPIASPCSFAPISAPHIHVGRESTTSFVSEILVQVDVSCTQSRARRVTLTQPMLDRLGLARLAVAVLREPDRVFAHHDERVAHRALSLL